jgi:hypothetical protein
MYLCETTMVVSTETFAIVQIFAAPAPPIARNRTFCHPLADEFPLGFPSFHPVMSGFKRDLLTNLGGHTPQHTSRGDS